VRSRRSVTSNGRFSRSPYALSTRLRSSTIRASFRTMVMPMSPAVTSRSRRLRNAAGTILLAPMGMPSPSHACSRASVASNSRYVASSRWVVDDTERAPTPADCLDADRRRTFSPPSGEAFGAGVVGSTCESPVSTVRTTARSSTTNGSCSTVSATGSTWAVSRHSGTCSAIRS